MVGDDPSRDPWRSTETRTGRLTSYSSLAMLGDRSWRRDVVRGVVDGWIAGKGEGVRRAKGLGLNCEVWRPKPSGSTGSRRER